MGINNLEEEKQHKQESDVMVSSLDITISGHKDVTDDSSNSTSSSDTEDDVSIGNKTENNNHQTGEAEKPITILDWRDDSGISDNLYMQSDRTSGCTRSRCSGSKMNTSAANRPLGLDTAITQARDFLVQYYSDTINHEKPEKSQTEREREVIQQLRERKTYTLTHDELVWGARMAWRNAPRCPARVIWKNLTVFDKRHIDDAEGMFEAIKEHLEFSNNGGNIRPAITVFRQRVPGKKDPRVWNNLMCQYAGYEVEDGSIIGDPAAVDITKFCQKLGWQGNGTPFDFLPMLLSGADGEPRYFDLPEHLCMKVKIEHPTNEGINSMGLEWFGLPGVSSMMLECGGLQFPGAPFAGWYQGTEVASRDFLDPQRYNLLNPIGEAMGLDMSSNTTLWKDEVALELNKAVLYSYKKAGISIVDHFTQADQFIDHLREETKVRGGCPADWVWIVPPQSGSLVSTFHQEMLMYHLSPSYEYQDKPYDTWYRGEKRKTFKAVARTIFLWMGLYLKMVKKRKVCTVFYSSETGTAKKFAKMAAELFNMSYKTQLQPLDQPPSEIRKIIKVSDIELVVASTFGNGESPEMSRTYTAALNEMVEMFLSKKDPELNKLLSYATRKYYAVFGLGSSAYPKFAAYGRHLDAQYTNLGANPMLPFTAGDELKDQRGTFNKWLRKVFLASLNIMKLEAPKAFLERINAIKQYRWKNAAKDKTKTSNMALSQFYDIPVADFKLTKRTNLHSEDKEPPTLKLDFEIDEEEDSGYDPGDHLSIFPRNDQSKVEFLKSRLNNNPPSNRLVTLQVESGGLWESAEDFPVEVTFDDMLTYFLDINQIPSQSLLAILAKFAEDKEEKETVTVLANDDVVYENWRKDAKDIVETLQEFVSININSSTLASQLGIIKPRKYSIASCPKSSGSELMQSKIHDADVSLIIGVLNYQTETGRNKKGLTTGMLESSVMQTKILGSIKNAHKSNFRLPDDPAWPVIMICAGSGIAPFRGFWMKRFSQCQEGQMVGQTQLYFGCRKKSMNLLKNETDMVSKSNQSFLRRIMCNDGIATDFEFEREVAYSREPNQPKQYVQNLLTRDAAKIYEMWVRKGGYVYICGKISMAEGVENALKDVLRHIGNMDTENVDKTFEEMRKNNRYQEDIFG